MNETLDLLDVGRLLSQACRKAGSQKAWAALHNISASYVNDVVQGRREPGPAILDSLGLAKVPTRYVNKRSAKVAG